VDFYGQRRATSVVSNVQLFISLQNCKNLHNCFNWLAICRLNG